MALISAIGSNMDDSGVLPMAINALDSENIKVLAIHKCMRDIDIQFVIEEDDIDKGIRILNRKLIEENVA